jgi:hypothetical protein
MVIIGTRITSTTDRLCSSGAMTELVEVQRSSISGSLKLM